MCKSGKNKLMKRKFQFDSLLNFRVYTYFEELNMKIYELYSPSYREVYMKNPI